MMSELIRRSLSLVFQSRRCIGELRDLDHENSPFVDSRHLRPDFVSDGPDARWAGRPSGLGGDGARKLSACRLYAVRPCFTLLSSQRLCRCGFAGAAGLRVSERSARLVWYGAFARPGAIAFLSGRASDSGAAESGSEAFRISEWDPSLVWHEPVGSALSYRRYVIEQLPLRHGRDCRLVNGRRCGGVAC